ncbi:GDSL esterase/lipase At5g33370-like [Rutidosis leptorrhynchoides]|uniref:GDSL esterase/lipase At5g33370-like n=1 Tax=Rutidosis leptorrhynchoides TaxID=125765 RepID=UPI003A99D0D1
MTYNISLPFTKLTFSIGNTFCYIPMGKTYGAFLSLLLGTFIVILQVSNATMMNRTAKPAIFIFGDSTADVGTNTLLPESKARADFPYNGIDFLNSKPTGRFSNGFNSADFLSKLLGHDKSPQPWLLFLKTRSNMFSGINFASGASGLLDTTGKDRNIISMSEQTKQFKSYYSILAYSKGQEVANKLIAKSLIAISVGSNDIFDYFKDRSTVDPDVFINSLMSAYEFHINELYDLGVRKFGIISVAPIGCCPSQRLYNATGGCLEIENTFAQIFYSSLYTLLHKLSSSLPDFKYSLANSYEMTINVINHPQLFNLTSIDKACCGEGLLNAENGCNPKANLCSNRNNYLFWDLYHPTQYAYELAAITIYNGGPQFVTPINFAQLVAY